MNRRRLLQTAVAALLAPAAARSLPAVAPHLEREAILPQVLELEGLPRFAQRGTIRYVTPPALSAAGGICAPVSPYYPLLELSADENPIRAALRMQA